MPGPYIGNPLAGEFAYIEAAYNDPASHVGRGSVTSAVWAKVQERYRSLGVSPPPGAFQAMSQLVGLAGERYRARAHLSAALSRQEAGPFDVAVTAQMAAPHLDTRALNEMVLGPQHRVAYLTQDLVEGEPVLSYKTHDFGYNLPQSISQLQRDVEDAAQITAADYGFEWGGVATPVGIYSY